MFGKKQHSWQNTKRTYTTICNEAWVGREKEYENIRKHRIDFADVQPLFDGPMYVTVDTRKNYKEERLVGIGLLRNSVIVVVYIEIIEETIRLISARKAEKNESKHFHKLLEYWLGLSRK